jgi:hypothetical protein
VTGRLADPAEVGGLHQVVSEMILSLFVDNRQRRKEINWYHLWYQNLIYVYRHQKVTQ